MEALREGAAHVPEQPELLFRLDAFGDRRETQPANQAEDRTHQLQWPFAGAEMADERPVDLDAVDRQTVEIA